MNGTEDDILCEDAILGRQVVDNDNKINDIVDKFLLGGLLQDFGIDVGNGICRLFRVGYDGETGMSSYISLIVNLPLLG